jgi:hypothetical protein
MNRIDLTAVIVSYNTRDYLKRALDSFLASCRQDQIRNEIIVIDNGSTDGSRQMLKKEYPKVATIFTRSNLGFGRANNLGIERARGEYILLLNSDAFALEDGIGRMLAFSKRHPRAFIGGKLFNMDGTPQPSCGPFFSLLNVFLMLFAQGDKLKLTRYSPADPRLVDWISGAAVMGLKRLFTEEDLFFDEKIFMYMEEVDLFYRARKKGIRVYFFPNAQFIHVGSGSAREGDSQPVINIFRGLAYFYRKHCPRWQQYLLALMLKIKAIIGMTIGQLTGNQYLMKTYEKAVSIS